MSYKLKKEVLKMIEKKKDKVLTIRMNEKDYEYLQIVSFMAGMTVSRYARTLLDATINACKVAEKEGKINIENIKAVRNNKL